MAHYAEKYVYATAAAVNVELGFIPHYCRVLNVSTGATVTESMLDHVILFDGGGGTGKEIMGGDIIQGATNGALAQVHEVIVDSGTWAGGNAEGALILDLNGFPKSGTFGDNENLNVARVSGNRLIDEYTFASDYATVDGAAQPAGRGIHIDAAPAQAGANESIAAYYGTAGSASRGVTLGSAIGADGNLLLVQGFGTGPG